MIKVEKFVPNGYFGSNTYVVSSAGRYAVIDPSVSVDTVVSRCGDIRDKIDAVLLTHAHFDHMIYINEWAELCSRVIVGDADAPALGDAYLNCYLGFLGVEDGYNGSFETVTDGDIIKLGDCEFRVIGCPGHTPGGVSYRCGDDIFVGDTLFDGGGYGRCDLPGGDENALEKSLIRLLTVEKDGVFHPGHGNSVRLRDAVKYFM